MALPATYNLELYEGDTFELVVIVQDDAATPSPIDLTGHTPSAQIRTNKADASPLATFTCTLTNAAGGEITCTLPATEAVNLEPTSVVPDAYWDLQTVDGGGAVRTWLHGTVTVTAEVTR